MKTFSTLAIFFITLTTNAQNNFMALSFGAGIPKGEYASSQSVFNSGFAHNGFVAEYSGAYFLKKYIGLGGVFRFNANLTDNEKISSDLDKYKYVDAPENTQISYNFSQWNLVSLAAGPIFSYPMGNLTIDAYIFAGLNVINQPKMELIGDMGNNNFYSVSLQIKNASVVLDGGINIRYRLNEYTGIKLFTGYQYSMANGEIIQQIGISQGNSLGSYHCNIQLIYAGLGLVYYL
jgi:hypothetical protein